MTLIKSSIPLTVYRAESPSSPILPLATRSGDSPSAPSTTCRKKKACGFVNCDDMFDTEWINSIPEKGHYMAFWLQGGRKAHRSRHSEKNMWPQRSVRKSRTCKPKGRKPSAREGKEKSGSIARTCCFPKRSPGLPCMVWP